MMGGLKFTEETLVSDYIPVLEKSDGEWSGRIINLPGYKVLGTKEEVEVKLRRKLEQINRRDED